MNRALGVILALMVTAAGGCAAGGTGSAGGEATAAPQREYPPGTPPSNNMWTRSAALYLDRAGQNPRADQRRGLYEQALEASREGIENDPGNPRSYFLAGQALIRLDNYVAADSMYTRAQEIYPAYEPEVDQERQNAWIMAYNSGVAALQGGQVDQARALFEKADVIFAKRPEARLNLGSLYAQAGEMDRAIEAYQAALEILRGPERENLPPNRAEQWEESEEVATFNLAQLLANAGRDAESIVLYRGFLADNPDHTTARINMAVVLSRMGETEEASRVYGELLDAPDLDAAMLFRVGIGLFQAEQFEHAAIAFRRSLELNPQQRDALYNLANALYAHSRTLEEARMASGGSGQEAELGALYTELGDVGARIMELDPNNKNVMALRAQALRGLSDIAESDARSQELRREALAVLERHEALPFEVLNVDMGPPAEGAVTVRGVVKNWKLPAGQPINLQITLLGETGSALSTERVTVPAPAAEQQTPFQVQIQAPGEVAGWKYEVAG